MSKWTAICHPARAECRLWPSRAVPRLRRVTVCCPGFTLLELSIVLVIIAVMTAGGAVYFAASIQQQQEYTTRVKIGAIQRALLDYRRTFRRLPCPAHISTYNTEDGYFGKEAEEPATCGGTPASSYEYNLTTGAAESCDSDEHCVYGGLVPTKTLGLPDEYAFDGWGRRLLYVVDGEFAAEDGFLTQSEVDADASGGETRITVLDGNDTVITQAGIYLLMSFGRDGHGAYPRNTESMLLVEGVGPMDEDVPIGQWTIEAHRVVSGWFLASAVADDRSFDVALGGLIGGVGGGGAEGGDVGSAPVARVNSGSTNPLQLQNCHCSSDAEATTWDATFYQSRPLDDVLGGTNGFDDLVVVVTRGQLTAMDE